MDADVDDAGAEAFQSHRPQHRSYNNDEVDPALTPEQVEAALAISTLSAPSSPATNRRRRRIT